MGSAKTLLQEWMGTPLPPKQLKHDKFSHPHVLSTWPACDQDASALGHLTGPGLGLLPTLPRPGIKHSYEAEGTVGRLFSKPFLP